MIHSAMGKTDLGMEELEKAEKLNGNSAEVQAALSSAYQRAHDMNKAKAAMQKAIDLAPDDWRWPYLMASLDLESGEFKPAEEQANTALAITPDNGLAYYNLGIAYLREGRYPDAETALEKSVHYTPTYRPLIALGNLFTWEAKYERAAQTIERSLQLKSTDYRAWASLAVAYAWNPATGEKAEAARLKAIELAEEERKVTPNDPRLLAALADYYADSKRGDKSLPLLREAVALAPDNPDILFFAAEGYETLGRRKEAIQFVTKALQLGYSADAVKRTPGMAELQKDKNAPEAIRIQ
jgi:tetratricopeptide (TPR) repeat protein